MAKINPNPHGFPDFKAQHPIRLSDLRRMAEQARQMMRSASTGDFDDVGGGMGYQHGAELVPAGFWARLIAYPVSISQPFYSFMEVQVDGTGQQWTTPNGAAIGIANAFEIDFRFNIDVPSGPILTGSGTGGDPLSTLFIYYMVTAIWQDATGQTYQSPFSNDIAVVAGSSSVTLDWIKPSYCLNDSPNFWPGTQVQRWAVVGYQIWKGPGPGLENVLVDTVDVGTTTYTDTEPLLSGTKQLPVRGGSAGPVVWMTPLNAWDFFSFEFPADPLPLAWVQVTSSSSSSVTLNGGATLTVYPAVLETFVDADPGGGWRGGMTVWWYDINGQKPQLDTGYQARLLAMADDGVPVWATAESSAQSMTFVGNLTGTGDNNNTIASISTTTGQNVNVWPCVAYLSLGAVVDYFDDTVTSSDYEYAWAWFPDGTPPRFSTSDLYRAWKVATTNQNPPGRASGTYNIYFLDYHAPYTQYSLYVPGTGTTNRNIFTVEPNLTIDATDIQFGPPYLPANSVMTPDTQPTSPAFTQLSINYGGIYNGATGTDGGGNILLAGLNVNVGGGSGTPVAIDGGSDW